MQNQFKLVNVLHAVKFNENDVIFPIINSIFLKFVVSTSNYNWS